MPPPPDVAGLRHLAGPLFDAMSRSGMAMVVTDPLQVDNPIIYVNDAFTTLTGYPAEAVLGRNCRLMQGADTDPETVTAIRAAVAAGIGLSTRILNYRPDGAPFWSDLSITPIQDAAGTVVLFVAHQVDVSAAQRTTTAETDLQTSQQRLERVDERLRVILSISGAAAAWEWHIAERLIVGDAGFAVLYGLSSSKAAAGIDPTTFFSLIHPLDAGRMRLAIGGMLHGAEILSKEYRVILPGGAVRWLHARARAQYDADGQSTQFAGVLVDITEQKRLEEHLRIAQTAGAVGTFQHIDGFGTVEVSTQFCELLGLHPATDLPVRTINAVVHQGDAPIIDPMTPGVPGAVSRLEFRIIRADTGETRWLMRRGEFLSDAETAGVRFSGVIYDITEAKRIESELRLLNETLETRVEQRTRERDRIWRVSQDLLGVSDMQGRWISVNPAWSALLGWSDAQVIGRTSEWLVHPDDLAATRDDLAALGAGQRSHGHENRFRTITGAYRWLSWAAVPEDGRIYCVARDVTVEKEAERALAQAEEQLRQSQKMEAVGQLTGGLAHDFNNLLTGIAGSLERMQTRIQQGRFSELDRYIDAAQGAARRAAALTHRLLAFSRRQTLDARATDLNRLVTGMEELVRRTVGPEIDLHIDATPELWSTLVDPNQMENALLNLCINARDAMPNGGRLVIATENHALDATAARARDLPPAQYVALVVRDEGTGMTPDVMARVFDPFFTTKPIGQGTGLGLSMIYGFVKQSGGHVRIASQLGEGTSVSLYLQRNMQRAEADMAADMDPTAISNAGRGETVLVVDDEPTVRLLIIEVLEELGYHTLSAEDGPAGLTILHSPQRINLLITDVGLPGGMNGRQLADASRVARPGLKVLFITGYAEKATLGQDDLAAGMHVLAKPFALDKLAATVTDLLQGPRAEPAGSAPLAAEPAVAPSA